MLKNDAKLKETSGAPKSFLPVFAFYSMFYALFTFHYALYLPFLVKMIYRDSKIFPEFPIL